MKTELPTGKVLHIEIRRDAIPSYNVYPFSIAAIRQCERLPLDSRVTFLVGNNGSGKSTIIEAIASALGINPEGGSRNFNFATRQSHSNLARFLRIARTGRLEDTFFLRAESVFNVATEIERLDDEPWDKSPKIIDSYGGKSLHEQSHGESFLAIARKRLGKRGFYLMDEPEAALSSTGQLALLSLIDNWVTAGDCQLLIATHSPILIGYPKATIYELSENGIQPVSYKETQLYQFYRDFLCAPELFLNRFAGKQ